MPTQNLVPISGVIQNIQGFSEDCCEQQITIRNSDGIHNFIIGSSTYIPGQIRLRNGMQITAFYDASLPIPLIYPPRYQAEIISRRNQNETIYAGFFGNDLEASDGSLRLNIGMGTEIVTANGQRFTYNLGGHNLLVYYTATTRSIPPQTTPRKIIVMC